MNIRYIDKEQKTSENEELVPVGCLMTFTCERLPQIVRSEDPPNFRGVARWKGLLHSKEINQYHVLHDRKNGNVMVREKEEKEEKADTGDEDVQGECKHQFSTLAHDLMEDRFYLDDIKEKTGNDIENRKNYENGRFNHVLQNKLIKVEIKLR
ncbi:hypothetical protein HZH68_016249 [Vespula germanica]|uniref:Uncharacterized protein n=1 Tax=Vespula germanica TaxID=30212 RepID=A0A834J4N3_VESGE|nr:hypothetical protein HZH68_016249 [Vespula germanica]